jgi:two-component system, cell cycle response regulator CtrA
MSILLVEMYPSQATSHIGDDHGVIVCAEDADEAIALLRHDSFDLVLISMLALPEDGFDLIRRMRRSGDDTPIVALTRGGTDDEVTARGLGADKALADPVDPAELNACIHANLRRAGDVEPPMLRLGDLSLCLTTRDSWFRQASLNLTAGEFSILELLVLRKGSVLTRTTFLKHLFSEMEKPDGRIIDVLMCKLRKKLERAGAGRLISIVWGHGYMISELDALRQRVSDTVTVANHGLVG